MFKTVAKMIALSLLVVVGCTFLDSPKASAAKCAWAPGDNWGVTGGESLGAMAGLKIYAQVGSRTNGTGDPNQGSPINVPYLLNSYLPGAPQRIFKYPAGDAGRDSARWFQTGETIRGGPNGSQDTQCDGWSVLGPGQEIPIDPSNPNGAKIDQWGNGWVLDCANGSIPTDFWISQIPNPNGQDGYWEIQVDGSTQDGTPNLSTQPMKHFHVINGKSRRVDLIWHAKPPQPEPPKGTCTYLQASNTGNYNGQSKRTHVLISGTNHDTSEYIPDPNGAGPSNTGTATRDYHYQPQQNAITVTVTTQYWDGSSWENLGGSQHIRTTADPCFKASCQINVTGDGPGGRVLAGGTAHVKGTYWNNSPGPDHLIIWNPAIQDSDKIGSWNGIHTLFGGPAYNAAYGYSYQFSFDMPAPGSITNGYFNFTPVYLGGPPGVIGGGCDASFPVYQKFSAPGVPPQSSLSPTDENPDKADYNTQVKVSGVDRPVHIPVTSCFYKEPPTRTSCSSPLLASTSGGNYPPGTTQWSGTYTIPDGSFVAGDRYCARIHMDYTSGYLGPGGPGDIAPEERGPSYDSSSCDKVTNKPYFKVQGSGASAGTALRKPDGTCNTTNGGLLAGWNNNSGGQERGAGAQLSALALVKITGFASAQTNMTRSPTDLTFANNGPGVSTSTDAEEPDLGGSFAASGYCMDNVAPAPGSTNLPANSVYGGNASVSGNQSIFVNGDVTITGNVSYGAWGSLDNAPSFVLKATGNIYIAPNVTRLDGLFVSDKKIYTCANSSGPITSNTYSTCKNQLLVRGSFAAEQIKLGRTFGSLRDEEPNPGTPAVPATPGVSILNGATWSSAGKVPGMSCVRVNEPADPNTWNDNYLCLPSSSTTQLGWTYDGGNTGNAMDGNKGPGGGKKFFTKAIFNALNASGNCAKWTVSGEPASHGWDDNYLCATQPGLSFSASNDPTKKCVSIKETADPHGQWAGGYYLCAPVTGGTPGSPALPPTPKGPPYTDCSNTGAQVTTASCASEVFELSPELYLARPMIQLPNNGSPQWDAMISLPPVL